MNRSALNAEVEYHLKMQELKRAQGQHRHEVPEMEEEQPGLLSRLSARLKRKQQPELEWKRPRRSAPGLSK
jgi:hypothetical protein